MAKSVKHQFEVDKTMPRKPGLKSFRSQVVSLGTPMLRQFAEEVESSLGVVVNRAVRDFFDRSRPGVGEVSPGVRPGSCPDFISGTNYGFRTYGPDDGGPASPPKPVDEQGGTAAREPAGFRRLGCVANAGWFNMRKIGNALHGTLEGMYGRRDDLRPEKVANFFQIKLMHPCEVRMGMGEEARMVEAKEGDYVNVNYGPRTKLLEPLIPLLARGAEFEVWGKVLGDKIQLPGGRSMHNFEMFSKAIKAPVPEDDDEPTFSDGRP